MGPATPATGEYGSVPGEATHDADAPRERWKPRYQCDGQLKARVVAGLEDHLNSVHVAGLNGHLKALSQAWGNAETRAWLKAELKA